MEDAKKKFEVVIKGGTIIADEYKTIQIMTIEDRVVYHLDKSARQDVSKSGLSIGDAVWLECVPERQYVLTAYRQLSQDKPTIKKKTIEI